MDCDGTVQNKQGDVYVDQGDLDAWRSAIIAFGYLTHNPAYIVGKDVYVQSEAGTCQTGAGTTTWMDNEVLKHAKIMINGVKDKEGNVYLLDSSYTPGLEFRDEKRVKPSEGQFACWAGREWNIATGTYRLERIQNSFYKKLQRSDDIRAITDAFGSESIAVSDIENMKCMAALTSLRHEIRGDLNGQQVLVKLFELDPLPYCMDDQPEGQRPCSKIACTLDMRMHTC